MSPRSFYPLTRNDAKSSLSSSRLNFPCFPLPHFPTYSGSVIYFLLYKPRRDSAGLLEPDTRILSLASIAAKSNIASLALQTTTLALILAYPRAFHFLTTSFLLSKCYTASLVLMFNMRDPANLSTNNSPIPQYPTSFATDVVAAAEEGRAIPLSVVLALEEEDERKPQKGFQTRMSMARSTGKNVSFYSERVEVTVETDEGSEVDLGMVDEDDEVRMGGV
jgi:hypothetical protein